MDASSTEFGYPDEVDELQKTRAAT